MTTENLMTLTTRDVFAFAALPAVIDECLEEDIPEDMTMERYFAALSYRIADAMIAERDK